MNPSLFYVALTLQLLPCISFSLTYLEINPFAFFVSLGYLAISQSVLPKNLWLLLIPPSFCLVLISLIGLGEFDFWMGGRSLIMYSTPFVIAACVYRAVKTGFDIDRIGRHVRFVMWIWCVAGVAQWLIDPTIIDFLVRVRAGSGRGVNGFAPEPSFYGMSVILMWLILYYIRPSMAMSGRYIVLMVFQVVFLAKAALPILIIALALALWLMVKSKRVFFVLVAVCLASGVYVFESNTLASLDFRFLRLLYVLIDSPSTILLFDGSVSERFFHMYLSLLNSFSDFLMPHGLYGFNRIIAQGQKEYAAFLYGEQTTYILSGLGAALYELGFFSIIYFVVAFRLLRRQIALTRFDKVFIACVLLLCHFNTVTLAAPYFGILLGLMAARMGGIKHAALTDVSK